MKKLSLLWLVSLLTLSVTAAEFVENQLSDQQVYLAERKLKKDICWNNKVANAMPFVSSVGSLGITFTALRIVDDWDGDNDYVVLPMITFLALSGPILLSRASSKIAAMPKYIMPVHDDTLEDLQRKVQESRQKIGVAVEFGCHYGVGLLGTGIAVTEALGILLGFVRCGFEY